MASGFSHYKEWVGCKVKIDWAKGNGADMGHVEGGTKLRKYAAYPFGF